MAICDEEGSKRVTKFNSIAVPQAILTADDCDSSLCVPWPLATWEECLALPLFEGGTMEFVVPSTTEPGCLMHVPLEGGEFVQVSLPNGIVAGDLVHMGKARAGGTWKIAKATTQFAFLLPDGSCPGDELTRELPDRTVISITVPEGSEAGELLVLKRPGAGDWVIDRLYVLPEVNSAAMPRPSEVVRGPYAAALQVIKDRGFLNELSLDSTSILQVSIPICGRFLEYPLLGDFVAKSCLPALPGARGARVVATESSDEYYYEWALAAKWFGEVRPEVSIQCCVRDLAEDPLHEAGLTIVLHPEVTHGGCWFAIVGSILRGARRGLCVFATFFEDEKDTLLNMIEMYREEGSTVHVLQNPYYDSHPLPESPASPRMRYLVVVSSGGSTST
eukprot:TRINITY_DN77234_c0_g1_i1.p1 TRINITY_DN77234_c0_g1~~TRINITY_DN77234_c0_g1_i1.p1  ORF type:complete len:390 (-),score=52.44 TRINITY_DN77234_c0_g1_i1:147-1316(-)